MENVPKYATKATKFEPANGGRRNMERSSIGLFTRFSVMTKAMPETPHSDEEREDPGRGVAGILSLNDGERHAGEEGCAEHESQHIDAPALPVGRLGDGHRRQHEGDDPESEVEPEDGAPARETDQEAADDRPQGEREA